MTCLSEGQLIHDVTPDDQRMRSCVSLSPSNRAGWVLDVPVIAARSDCANDAPVIRNSARPRVTSRQCVQGPLLAERSGRRGNVACTTCRANAVRERGEVWHEVANDCTFCSNQLFVAEPFPTERVLEVRGLTCGRTPAHSQPAWPGEMWSTNPGCRESCRPPQRSAR